MVFYHDDRPLVAHWDHGPGELGLPELTQMYETHFRVIVLRFEYAVSEAESQHLQPLLTDNVRRQIDFMQQTGNVPAFTKLVRILAEQRDSLQSSVNQQARHMMRLEAEIRKLRISGSQREETLRRILRLKTTPKPKLP